MRLPICRRKRLLLRALEKTGNVSAACRAVGWGRTSAYHHKAKDPAFGAAWEEFLARGVAALEAAAMARILTSPGPNFLSGPMIERLLRLHRPDLYADRFNQPA